CVELPMTVPVFIGSAFVANYPTGGGNFWVPLQYVLGLRALGVEAYWLEMLWPQGDIRRAREVESAFCAYVGALGVSEWVAVVLFPENEREAEPRASEHVGLTASDLWARARDGVLLNMANSVPASLRGRFGRTVLFDLDPGLFQLWARDSDLGVGTHDAYVTIGQNLGAADCPVPLGDIPWQRVWPAVHLPAWPYQQTMGRHYTTVTQWWGGGWGPPDGELLDANKRSGFMELIELPRQVSVPLEIAANIHPSERDDLQSLARNGWHVVDPAIVAGTPTEYRRYVQQSRGEFSCAKPAYGRVRAGWVSDRTLCSLASGRPCVVPDTGSSAYLPPCSGLRFFQTLDEAVAAFLDIEAEYAAASHAARRLAEEVFGANVVLPSVLRAIGLS